MQGNELKRRYIDFFVSRNHTEISGKSLIPENDPSVLFTTAGMHPLIPYLLGENHPSGSRLVNVQKCIRTVDIESVGDSSHLTFFEMLGNWSIRDYFKKEAIAWSYEFLTNKDFLGLNKNRIYVTVFEGDNDVPFDYESYNAWLSLAVPKEHIFKLPREENWWQPAGRGGPCGPDSEMFYDTGAEKCGSDCRPGCFCGKYFEIWNDVFIEYNKQSDGSYVALETPCVDTGMGVERTISMLQGKKTVYETELFAGIIRSIEDISGKKYRDDDSSTRSFRIIADHVKTAAMILGDGNAVRPSNLGQGYILRRLIRRCVRHGLKIGIDSNFLAQVAESVIRTYESAYVELASRQEFIQSELSLEEIQFRKTLNKGNKEFYGVLADLNKNKKRLIPGQEAFHLYDTYGFPIELTQELAEENNITVDRAGFDEAYRRHQEISKKGADKTFKGGLVDDSLMSIRYHTATHLLHEALRRVLGEHVAQKGSNITGDRLRFDFVHPRPMTDEEKKSVEKIVNDRIAENLPVSVQTMTIEQAKNINARALFEGKYGEQIRVYSIGNFSTEVCGGPHVESIGDIGEFKIVKEQSVSRGIRRVRAVLT
ncbi:Alanyl-tRNA synthetase [Olavius algarvensis spirochete endosymbiont]|uniref:alanine--tRNA ligase n=1 Tax=Olavius algarvensis spirochete endosymbiont TaxID=260710 RepID=UPI000F2AD561|nr:alanine--tRNA ligase [Olavius algarvensis spirochete endosymbiont]CAD7842155.1 MAG: Alanyl-tRNA synthetase (EC 6.1.1.7) [Olavius algarvensis spirochete endosymbiont]VDB00803.1 Alanyl-tRNA synthetase [Olavius algarvensis spirochete endosymbiont]